MRTIAVIGKNFGDEGKGYTCSRLASSLKKSLIIKHNGGGQAGHTVEDPEGKWRFIHHQIGAGAEYHVPTLFADSFMPDLFQLGKEVKAFTELFGFQPILYSEKNARITTIDDVLLNMGAELARGKNRHGSCGMGIEECVQRNAAGYGITVEELATWSKQDLLHRLKQIREEYTGRRAKILGIQEPASSIDKNQSNLMNLSTASNPSNSSNISNPYYEMLNNETVLENFVEEVKENVKLLTLVDADRKWLEEFMQFQHLIFETGQGLLLDQDYEAYAPHLTSSKTGIHNPAIFLEKRGLSLDEAIYVTRPYVTRHGNGPLPCEVDRSELPGVGEDLTNQPNEWQGTLRYAKHESLEAFFAPVIRDRDSLKQDERIEHIKKESTETTETKDVTGTTENIGGKKLPKCVKCHNRPKLSILVTQLSETGNQLYFEEGNIPFETLQKAGEELGISCVKDIEQF